MAKPLAGRRKDSGSAANFTSAISAFTTEKVLTNRYGEPATLQRVIIPFRSNLRLQIRELPDTASLIN